MASEETTKKNKAKMLVELEVCMGIVSTACKRVNMSRQQHYHWVREDEIYREAVNSLLDVSLDLAETSLLTQIKAQNTSATIFYLKTKGKHRGYIERHEFTGIGNEPITIRIIESGNTN